MFSYAGNIKVRLTFVFSGRGLGSARDSIQLVLESKVIINSTGKIDMNYRERLKMKNDKEAFRNIENFIARNIGDVDLEAKATELELLKPYEELEK